MLKLLSYYNPFNARLPSRMIMVARHKEDTSWLDVYLSDIPHVVYQVCGCSLAFRPKCQHHCCRCKAVQPDEHAWACGRYSHAPCM